jgi:hypothetical protein
MRRGVPERSTRLDRLRGRNGVRRDFLLRHTSEGERQNTDGADHDVQLKRWRVTSVAIEQSAADDARR